RYCDLVPGIMGTRVIHHITKAEGDQCPESTGRHHWKYRLSFIETISDACIDRCSFRYTAGVVWNQFLASRFCIQDRIAMGSVCDPGSDPGGYCTAHGEFTGDKG